MATVPAPHRFFDRAAKEGREDAILAAWAMRSARSQGR